MKKTFWIVYVAIFVVVLAAAFFMLKSVNAEIAEKSGELESKEALIKTIKQKIEDGQLPNRIWPDVYRERLQIYKDVELNLKDRLERYNARLTKTFPVSNDLFDGEFKKAWLAILQDFLKLGFEVQNPGISPANLREQFASGNLARDLGIPMEWGIFTPSPSQRKIAEEQFWVQERLIQHFAKAENDDRWEGYEYKRKDAGVNDPGAALGRGVSRMRRSGGGSDEQVIPPPGIMSIFFRAPSQDSASSRDSRQGGAAPRGDAERPYVMPKTYFDEYHFSASFRMRLSALPGFINSMVTDKDFFFVVDNIKIKSLVLSENEKIGREFKAEFKAENEPPVELLLTGRVLLFDLARLQQGSAKKDEKAKSGDGAKPAGRKRP